MSRSSRENIPRCVSTVTLYVTDTSRSHPGSSAAAVQVQDAQATMRLYTLVKKQWEAEIKASKINKDSEKKKERKPKSPQVKGKRGTGL